MTSFSVYNDDTYDNMYVNAINAHSINVTGMNLIGDLNINGDLRSNTVNGTTSLTTMSSTGLYTAGPFAAGGGPSSIVSLNVAGNCVFATAGGVSTLGFFGVNPPQAQQTLDFPGPLPAATTGTVLVEAINDLKKKLTLYGLFQA